MNIQLNPLKKRPFISSLHTIKNKGIRLLKHLFEFLTAVEPDAEKRKNELDYFDYTHIGGPENKK